MAYLGSYSPPRRRPVETALDTMHRVAAAASRLTGAAVAHARGAAHGRRMARRLCELDERQRADIGLGPHRRLAAPGVGDPRGYRTADMLGWPLGR